MRYSWIKSLFVSIVMTAGLSSFSPGQFSKAVEDNSFFIEEAYNQETGIVQHISTGMLFRNPKRDLEFSFTQEWPLFGQEHQISYTLPYSVLDANTIRGIGDVAVHYRYQLQSSQGWAAISPRVSIILPVGNEEQGLGTGTLGWEFNVPMSKRLSEQFVGHLNAGITTFPSARMTAALGAEARQSLTSYFAGGSIIWLARSDLNLMLEYLMARDAEFNLYGQVDRRTKHILAPGLRYAADVGDLQIVPGIAFPIAFSKDLAHGGVLAYISFEHPF